MKSIAAVIFALALTLRLSGGVAAAGAPDTTLRFIPLGDLRSLDPIWTTSPVTRNYGYMVYDTLFSLDDHLDPQPQMVKRWKVSDDRLTYTFTLREGLKFSDGQPVGSADCIASLKRWSRRDALGQSLAAVLAEYRAINDKTFAIVLKKPFPLLLAALGKLDASVPFIMPEHAATTDPHVQITDTIGSGPFIFVKKEWEPGHKVVFVKNPEYVPRKEPPDWATGGKVVHVDRVEWLYMPDPQTAFAAFTAGEADWWENPPPDFYPLLERDRDVRLVQASPFGLGGILRFNHLLPPFDKQKMRQALLYAVDQREYMRAVAGSAKYWRACFSVYACGSPMASTAGAEPLEGPRDFAKAKELIAAAGYHGEKIVLLDQADSAQVNALGLVTNAVLRQLGINVEMEAVDTGTFYIRRTSKAPIDKGGWNLFVTALPGILTLDPATHVGLRGNGAAAWPGWPTDPAIEKLRDRWIDAADAAERRRIAAAIQRRAFVSVPFVPLGEWSARTVFHKDLSNVNLGPVLTMWSVVKNQPGRAAPNPPKRASAGAPADSGGLPPN